jgi:hypothetical protein
MTRPAHQVLSHLIHQHHCPSQLLLWHLNPNQSQTYLCQMTINMSSILIGQQHALDKSGGLETYRLFWRYVPVVSV